MDQPLFLRTIPVLPVSDIAWCKGWYENTLGFETLYVNGGNLPGETANYAVLRRETIDLHLILDELPHGPSWTKAGTGYLYLIVRNVDDIYRHLQQQAVEITRGLQTESWGARAFNLADPSGNVIHVEQIRECGAL